MISSFAREDVTIAKFDELADSTQKKATKAAVLMGTMHGIFMGLLFGFYNYTYFVGSYIIMNRWINPNTGKEYEISEIVTVAQALIMSMMTFASISPIMP